MVKSSPVIPKGRRYHNRVGEEVTKLTDGISSQAVSGSDAGKKEKKVKTYLKIDRQCGSWDLMTGICLTEWSIGFRIFFETTAIGFSVDLGPFFFCLSYWR